VNLKGMPAHVGKHCGSNRYDVSGEMAAFYADALDDHHPLHAEYAPPLILHSECYRFVGDWYLKNLFGNLHAQQDWEFFAPIPIGSSVRTRSTIVDRYQKRGRDYVLNETDVVSEHDGSLLVRGRTHQSFLPPSREKQSEGGDYVVDGGTAGQKAQKAKRPAFPTATGRDLAASTVEIDERRCWMFSGPGRNYHTDADEARKLGFPNIVVQGMMTTCFVSTVMQREFGMSWLLGGRMSVKLTNVTWVDETITCRARVREETPEGTQTRVHCDVWAEKVAVDDASASPGDPVRTLIGTASALL
jgi:acyl dehydratase